MPFGLHLESVGPTVAYAGGIAAFVASAVYRRPHIGIYYIVPLLPLQTVRYHLHELPLGSQWIDLMLLGVGIGAWRNGYSIFSNTFTRIFLIFGLFTYLSLWRGAFYLSHDMPLWFDDPRLSDWKNYMVIFWLFFMVLVAIRNSKQMKILLALMCVSMVLINRSYIHTESSRDFSHFSYDVRDAGTMGYAGVNGLATLEAQFSVFLIGLYSLEKKRLTRWGYLGVIATCLGALVYTLSRGGYLALLVGTLFVGIVKNRKLILVLGVFFLTWQSLVPPAVSERVFMTKGEDGKLDNSAGDRVILWQSAIEIFTGDPVFGTGYETYRYMHAVGPYEDTHNVYLKVMLETGVIGLLLFLGIFTKIFSAGWRLFRMASADNFARGLALGLAGMMVATILSNLFGDRWSYIEETGFTMTVLAMVVRSQMIATEEAEAMTLDVLEPASV